MNTNEESGTVEKSGSWWAASSNNEYESISLYEKVGGRESLLDSITVTRDEYPSLEDFKVFIKKTFGGGIYVALVRSPNGTFGKRVEFAISGRPIREANEEAQAQSQPSQQSDLALLFARMEENQRRNDERFLQLMEPMRQPTAPVVDPLEQMERFANIMQKTGSAPRAEKGLFEQLKEFKEAASLFGLDAKESDEGWTPAIVELLAGLREFSSESAKTERLKIAAEVKKAQPQATLPAPVEPAKTEIPPITGNSNIGLLKVLDELVKAAEAQADVREIADQLIAAAPSAEVLKNLLEQEDALVQLQRFNPKVGQYFDWFEQLANTVLEKIDAAGNADTASGNAEPTPEPEATASNGRKGDKANAATHAGARKPRKAAA